MIDTHISIKDLISMYDEGMSCKQIGDKIGMSKSGVRYRLKKSGMKFRYGNGCGAKGKEHYCWKGGRVKNKKGYWLIYSPEHPFPSQTNYVFEHKLVWEKENGKYLPSGWIIHHLNGVKSDNRIENLLALPRGAHAHLGYLYCEKIKQLEDEIIYLKTIIGV